MTVPARRTRPIRPGRRFDLRATAMFFGLAAVGLCVVGWALRMAFDVAERRPAWAVVLVLGLVLAGIVHRSGRSGLSARRLARRTTGALQEATATAMEVLEEERAPVVPAAPAPGAEEAVTVVVVDHRELSPDEFEQAIAELCVRDGCADVEVVGGAGDLGADVTATAPDGRRVVIQCKRYGDDNKVGSQDLQRFGGTCFTVHEADVAVLVTTSDFTEPATDYAAQCGILCVNEERLREWSEGLAPAPWAGVPFAEEEAAPPPGRAVR
ncbi:putative membrane protein [Streptomyces ambofaciens ATCC 23877]|uniref:Putative membrane protein n=1 Tax=Streptomyces ambofaciens (strain ATCC 23877 / 3486 / DSM 40053 / JCM 4204 / NBRC 12836 / NRRL B-2516) TaxID=278992 RepID=A3KIX5_STRA7|nr:restriction endonuclease [Streptomyces ambofaciens]AKZ53800.1 putative membrane protein [Streptomyces ambofaciens ATCC 23877]CAJ89659.1 putative membrane protein [Streptomyces ambofaciens ATCC 23877]